MPFKHKKQRMDSSWFDVGIIDDVVTGVGFPSRRRDRDLLELRTRWTSVASSHNVAAASVSHRTFLEETRSLDLDLQATSARIREATRFATGDGHEDIMHDAAGVTSRRLQFAQRFNDLLRRNSIVDDVVTSEKSHFQDNVNQLRGRLKCLEEKYREHIAVLEFQVKAHKDDWEAERSEKQQLLKDKITSEAKVRQLQKDVRCLKLKLKEERLENASHHCECCGLNATAETETTNQIPVLKDNKTYRTSVHLPFTSVVGKPLKQGATAVRTFDDVLIDVEENASSLDVCVLTKPILKTQISPEGFLRSASTSDEDSLLSFTDIMQKQIESKLDKDPSLRSVRKRNGLCYQNSFDSSEKCNDIYKNALEYPFVAKEVPKHATITTKNSQIVMSQSASQPNLTTPTTLSCSILHITPCLSSSNTAARLPAESATDLAIDGTSGVTIGYSSNGLASVCSFPQTPIVKSFSLPTARVADKITSFECEFPVSGSSSLSSSWSALANNGQPSQAHVSSVDSVLEEKKSGKLSILGAFAKSMKQSKECFSDNKDQLLDTQLDVRASSQNTAMWNAKYFENGVATQTGEDLMCPTCGQIFQLIEHVKFLDHFEKCQSFTHSVGDLHK